MRHDGRYEFAGTAIDGPDRGKHIVQPGPYYRRATYPRLSVVSTNWCTELVPTMDYHFVEYVWSYDLDQWCMRY